MNIFSFCLNSFYKTSFNRELLNEFSNKYKNSIKFTPLIGKEENATVGLNILLLQQSNNTTTMIRGELLQNNPIKSILYIKSPNINALFHTEIKTLLIKIAKEFNVEINVIQHSTLEPEIHIFGSTDAIEYARMQVLVLLDQLSGLIIDTLDEIPCYLHNLISGRKHIQLQSIMEETLTNIYLQSPFHNTCNSGGEGGRIHLSGESTTSLNRAKELLMKLAAQKSKSMYHKDSVMDSRKIDWILLNKRIELRKIMRDNGSFFLFPALGSGSNSISIYAENRINVERSIRLLNYLTSNIYEASFDFIQNNLLLVDASSIEKLVNIICQLSQSSGADVLFQSESNKLQLFGTERQVRNAYQLLCDMNFFKENHQFTTFSLELATDQREFLSGKKNGKINKIMKSCTVAIRFSISNEYNSSIHVESNNYIKALDGLTMLQDELPAETSFYVPEIYHRRIIGVAGKNIQKVMKKYGVYVKFSGAEEFTSLGGYFENEDNVVARTPMKNQMNLDNLKHAVTEFISFQKDKDYTSTTMVIPYVLQRSLPSKYGSQLREICRTNNAKIGWPERLGSDQVVIYGPQSQIDSVIMLMTSFITLEKHVAISITNKNEIKTLLEKEFVSKLQQKMNVDLTAQHVVISNNVNGSSPLQWVSCYDESDYILYRLRYKYGQEGELEKAKEIIQSSMEAKDIAFNELAAQQKPSPYTPPHHHAVTTSPHIDMHLLSLVSSSPVITENDDTSYAMLHNNMPSPPLSESLHPHDFVTSSYLLSVPHPTGKNIWASPSDNMIPPMETTNSFIHSLPSPPPYQPMMPRIKMQPSFSAPIIGSSSSNKPHHKSWPDVFFGGRDLFDTLPIRRSSTQHSFEFIPNSTTAVDNSIKYHQHVPFIYSNVLPRPGVSGPHHHRQTNRPHGFNI